MTASPILPTAALKASKNSNINQSSNKKSKNKSKAVSSSPAIICWRFPESQVCACTIPCQQSIATVKIYEIIPGLFVGSVVAAFKHEWLYNEFNIRRILNVSNEKYSKNEKLFQYLQICIEDALHENLIPHFKKTNKFIEEALEHSNVGVYVHCRAGISRSPSVIIAYLMWKRNISYKDADKIVGKVHPDANPNSSFREQLQSNVYWNIIQEHYMCVISKEKQLMKQKKQLKNQDQNKNQTQKK